MVGHPLSVFFLPSHLDFFLVVFVLTFAVSCFCIPLFPTVASPNERDYILYFRCREIYQSGQSNKKNQNMGTKAANNEERIGMLNPLNSAG